MTPGDPQERLADYRAKRDFAVTAEPSGTDPPPDAGHRFVVQRHRASRLHYDLRLEIDGVLVSWAVPKGPTLDPDARRLAVHVEDHPLDYFDFEGLIPAGEYGGGDVIVWDWGTWALAEGDDAQAAVDVGDLHVDLRGEKLAGRFVLVHRGRGERDWLLLHKHDDEAVAGWDPEDHPRSVKSGRTNDEVRARPDATWTRHGDQPTWDPATGDELAALDALGANGTWELQGHTVRLTDLDKVLSPGRDDEPPVTKRDLVRHLVGVAPHLLPYLHDRAVNLHRYPNGVGTRGFWQKKVPDHAPDWVSRWANPDADPGKSNAYVVADNPATLAWLANEAAFELHAWTSPTDAPDRPSWALIDLDPGTDTTFDDLLVLARLHRTALEHLGVKGQPKVTGRRGIQVWVPVRHTGRGAPDFAATRAWVERLSKSVGAVVPELVSWKWARGDRGGLARLDYTQNAVNKTLVAPYSPRPAPGAPVSMPISWDELDDPALRPDGFGLRAAIDRVRERGDLFRPVLGVEQELPPLT